MIDDCLTVEDLDQQSHSRAGSYSVYPQQISADFPRERRGRWRICRNTIALGTQLPWLSMSSIQCHWGQPFGDMTVEGTHHNDNSGPSLVYLLYRECTSALDLESKAEVYVGNFQGF